MNFGDLALWIGFVLFVVACVWAIGDLLRGKPKGERKMRADVFRGEDGQWYFRIVAENGEPVAHSEGYKNQKDARDTAFAISAARFVIRVESDQQELR
jgi:uncharacterized protein YegP (UPF0339 family)